MGHYVTHTPHTKSIPTYAINRQWAFYFSTIVQIGRQITVKKSTTHYKFNKLCYKCIVCRSVRSNKKYKFRSVRSDGKMLLNTFKSSFRSFVRLLIKNKSSILICIFMMLRKHLLRSFRFVPCLYVRFVRLYVRYNYIIYVYIYLMNYVIYYVICLFTFLRSLSISYVLFGIYSTKLFGSYKNVCTFVFKKQTNETDIQNLNI